MLETMITNSNMSSIERNKPKDSATEIIELTRQMRDEQTEALSKKIAKELTNQVKKTKCVVGNA